MIKLLKKYSDEIGSAAAIFGVAVGVVGFWLTICQLKRTEETLRAANTYAVQQDARDIVDALISDEIFAAFVGGTGDPADKDRAIKKLWKMQNFYLSVYRQSKAGGLSESFTNSFRNDFCNFVVRPPVAAAWADMTAAGQLSKDNDSMRGDWCETPGR